MAKLEDEQLVEALIAAPSSSDSELAERFGVTPATIRRRTAQWLFELKLAKAQGIERAITQAVASGLDETDARERVKASREAVSKAGSVAWFEAERAGLYSERASAASTATFTEGARLVGLQAVGSGKYGPTSGAVEAFINGLSTLTKNQWSQVIEEGRFRHRQMVDPHWTGPRLWDLENAARQEIETSGRRRFLDLANADVGAALESNSDSVKAAIKGGRGSNAFDRGSGPAAEEAITYALTGVVAKDLITTEQFGMLWLCFTGVIPMEGLPPEAATFRPGFDRSTKAMDKIGCAVLIALPIGAAASSVGLLVHRLIAG